jgi:hypothetical protein
VEYAMRDTLNEMDIEELRELDQKITHHIRNFETIRRKVAMEALADTAEQHGFSLFELVGKRRPRKP